MLFGIPLFDWLSFRMAPVYTVKAAVRIVPHSLVGLPSLFPAGLVDAVRDSAAVGFLMAPFGQQLIEAPEFFLLLRFGMEMPRLRRVTASL